MGPLVVYNNADPKSQKLIPFLLDVQSEVLSALETRMVVPLYLRSAGKLHPISRLTPIVIFQRKTLIAMVPEMAGIGKRHLGPVVGQLPEPRSDLLAAIDLLISGF